MQKINQAVIRQIFTLLLIVALGLMIFIELVPYLTGLLGAITFYILFRNIMRKMVHKGWNASLSAILLMLISFIGILVPIGLVSMMLLSKFKRGLERANSAIQVVKDQVVLIENNLGIELTSSIDSEQSSKWLSDGLQSLLGDTFNIFIAISIMYFLLYFMLVNRKQFIESLYTYMPMHPENISIIGKDIESIVKSNAVGIPLVAILQGLVAVIGFYMFGVPNPWFWFVITTIGSMIPFVGTALGILPVVILLFSTGQNWQAIAMLLYGLIVVASTDNVFRVVVQRRLADIHPLITLIGVIIGIPLFGFMGLIFGPLLISLFLLLLRIYKKEYSKAREENEHVKQKAKTD
ncbi:MAG: AI-2E family transporter [Flavobacteriaceae bacterium]